MNRREDKCEEADLTQFVNKLMDVKEILQIGCFSMPSIVATKKKSENSSMRGNQSILGTGVSLAFMSLVIPLLLELCSRGKKVYGFNLLLLIRLIFAAYCFTQHQWS
jgi:hypothetical protein